jgi:hypothetical protein
LHSAVHVSACLDDIFVQDPKDAGSDVFLHLGDKAAGPGVVIQFSKSTVYSSIMIQAMALSGELGFKL